MDVKSMLRRAAELCEAGELDESFRLAERVLEYDPHQHFAIAIAAMCQMKAGRIGVAYHLFRRVLEYDNREEVWNNLGYCLGERHANLKEAITWYEKCLDGEDAPTALANLAMVYSKMGDHPRAVDHAEAALAARPDWHMPKVNAAMSMLAMKQWRKGWEWYDEALGTHPSRPRISYHDQDTPLWDGHGGSVIIYPEQGLGDQIMFASMVQEAIDRAEHVVLDAEPRLVGLFKRSFPRATVVSSNRGPLILPEPREIDAAMPIGSLGRLFRNDDGDFPGTAYLKPDHGRVVQWRALLDLLPKRPKIGVMWQGGTATTGEDIRSVTLDDLLPVLGLDAEFISLNHRKGAEREIAAFSAKHGYRIWHWDRVHRTGDYDDTAALIEALDCVVSVTTSVIHMAGALGKKVYCLVPKMPAWRYGNEGKTIPWYGSVALYRETESGWRAPVMLIANDLGLKAKAKNEAEPYGIG